MGIPGVCYVVGWRLREGGVGGSSGGQNSKRRAIAKRSLSLGLK